MVVRVVFGVNTPDLGTITHTNRMSDAHWARVMATYTEMFTVRELRRGSGPVIPEQVPTPQQVIEKLSARMLTQIKRDVGEYERRAAVSAAIGGIPPIDTVKE
jgi:hypothetical protein